MEQHADQSAYVKLKDNKENFKTKLPCWLINSAKSESGIFSKVDLEKINKAITNQRKCNQWRNTQTVIDWFKLILNKIKARFIKFDIVQFFCSITEKLLDNVVSYAQTLTTIPDYIIEVIRRTKKSFLSVEGNIWMKKVESALFDVTIGSHDGAEVRELVGIYLLGKLSRIIYEKNIGLYRGDRLYVIENANGSQLDGLRKGVFAIFHNVGLKITTTQM